MKTTLISFVAACMLSATAFQTMGAVTPPARAKFKKVHTNHLKKYNAHHSCKKHHERVAQNSAM